MARAGSLYRKLALALLVLLACLGAVQIGLMPVATRLYLQEVNQSLNRDLARGIAAEEWLMRGSEVNREALAELFHVLMVVNPSIEVYLVDAEGVIVGHAAPPERVIRERISLVPVHRFVGGDSDYPILGDDPRDPSRRKVFSAAPIRYEGRTEGFLYIVLGGESYDSFVEAYRTSAIIRLSVWLGAASIVLALAAGLVSFKWLTRRLARLATAMAAFKGGEAPAPLVPASAHGDEIDQLGASFEEMRARISEQMTALRRADATRREMVANISHDLRTPLATLQGTLDTLRLKDKTLSEEEKRRYLELAAKNSARLNRLVAELFELARLEHGETVAHEEPFAIDELVQDVAAKFSLAAEKRQVGLALDVPRRAPIVSGDIGLIERVLENLIDNAIKFTHAGGAVSLSVEAKNGAVETSVSDTGCGIAAQHLPRIFDRFHRVEASRSDGRPGAGLGLAIAKRIVELHGSSLQVASTEGLGTTFRFSLRAAEGQ